MNFIELKPLEREFQVDARALILQGLEEHWGWIDEQANPDIDDLMLAFSNGYFLTAWKANLLVGTGGIKFERSGVLRIERMVVRKEFRRSGIGYQILDELVDFARRSTAEEVVLETTSSWKEAISSYNCYGFKIFAVDKDDTHFELLL